MTIYSEIIRYSQNKNDMYIINGIVFSQDFLATWVVKTNAYFEMLGDYLQIRGQFGDYSCADIEETWEVIKKDIRINRLKMLFGDKIENTNKLPKGFISMWFKNKI
ncbi:hypothetical protein HPT25_01635 [Bacillus sp. BRMEA1]|nr:hypothetical protein [Neobacillus endophyticus]